MKVNFGLSPGEEECNLRVCENTDGEKRTRVFWDAKLYIRKYLLPNNTA